MVRSAPLLRRLLLCWPAGVRRSVATRLATSTEIADTEQAERPTAQHQHNTAHSTMHVIKSTTTDGRPHRQPPASLPVEFDWYQPLFAAKRLSCSRRSLERAIDTLYCMHRREVCVHTSISFKTRII